MTHPLFKLIPARVVCILWGKRGGSPKGQYRDRPQRLTRLAVAKTRCIQVGCCIAPYSNLLQSLREPNAPSVLSNVPLQQITHS